MARPTHPHVSIYIHPLSSYLSCTLIFLKIHIHFFIYSFINRGSWVPSMLEEKRENDANLESDFLELVGIYARSQNMALPIFQKVFGKIAGAEA